MTEGNLECTADGVSIQAMDTSHVALVMLMLRGGVLRAFLPLRALFTSAPLSSFALMWAVAFSRVARSSALTTHTPAQMASRRSNVTGR